MSMLELQTLATERGRDRDLPSAAVVVRAAEDRGGRDIRLGGLSPNRVKVSARDTDGRMALFEYEGHGEGGPPLHVHDDQDEVFVVCAGRYLFQVGEAQRLLQANDTIFLPRGTPHSFRQLEAYGRLLFMLTPAADMEGFFEAHARLDASPDFPALAPKLFADYGMRVVGPPIVGGEELEG